MGTTCHNYECPLKDTCQVNIWNGTYKNRQCPEPHIYYSAKEIATRDYLKQQNRMPINIYFEH